MCFQRSTDVNRDFYTCSSGKRFFKMQMVTVPPGGRILCSFIYRYRSLYFFIINISKKKFIYAVLEIYKGTGNNIVYAGNDNPVFFLAEHSQNLVSGF